MAEWAVTFHASFVDGENLKTFKADFTDNDRLSCSFGDVIQVDPHPVPEPYPGPYVFNGNGNITRSNALEVTKDGGIVLKSPNGTKYKITVADDGTLTMTAVT